MLKLECQWRRIRNLNQVRDLRRFEGERAGRSRRLLLVDLLDSSRDGFVFVLGKASLLSQTFNRDLLVSIENEGDACQFIKLKLRAKPRKEDETWSEWMTATERADLTPVPAAERIAVRYRVQEEE